MGNRFWKAYSSAMLEGVPAPPAVGAGNKGRRLLQSSTHLGALSHERRPKSRRRRLGMFGETNQLSESMKQFGSYRAFMENIFSKSSILSQSAAHNRAKTGDGVTRVSGEGARVSRLSAHIVYRSCVADSHLVRSAESYVSCQELRLLPQ